MGLGAPTTISGRATWAFEGAASTQGNMANNKRWRKRAGMGTSTTGDEGSRTGRPDR